METVQPAASASRATCRAGLHPWHSVIRPVKEQTLAPHELIPSPGH